MSFKKNKQTLKEVLKLIWKKIYVLNNDLENNEINLKIENEIQRNLLNKLNKHFIPIPPECILNTKTSCFLKAQFMYCTSSNNKQKVFSIHLIKFAKIFRLLKHKTSS